MSSETVSGTTANQRKTEKESHVSITRNLQLAFYAFRRTNASAFFRLVKCIEGREREGWGWVGPFHSLSLPFYAFLLLLTAREVSLALIYTPTQSLPHLHISLVSLCVERVTSSCSLSPPFSLLLTHVCRSYHLQAMVVLGSFGLREFMSLRVAMRDEKTRQVRAIICSCLRSSPSPFSQLTFETQLTADEVKALSKQPKKTAEFSLDEELRVRIERPTVFVLLHEAASLCFSAHTTNKQTTSAFASP